MPPDLKDVQLWTLDIGLLQAGASMKGEFENRLRSVIDEVQASPKPIILFIDEAHTLIGAGGAAGTGDAANLLKPALARGTLRTIAATTWSEYKKYIEKDPALTRRFQVVQVLEPSEDKTLLMVRGVASTLEKHHRVQLLDEALEAAVKLSHRYIPARQLPDKAVSLLDTTCARVAVSQHATPPDVEDSRRRIEALDTELGIIGREDAAGFEIGSRRTEAEARLAVEKERLAGLDQRWAEERELVDRILELRRQLRDETEAAEPGRAGGAAHRAARAPVEAHAGAGGVAADPAQRRCSSRRLRRRRLDRRPRGPDGQERGRRRPQACRHPRRARRGPASRPRDDRPAHPDLPRAAGQSEQAHRRVPPGRTLRAWARRRRRWRWPSRSTGARTTSSPST